MKKLVALLAIACFAGSVIAQNAPQQKAEGKNAPRVAEDKGKDKDRGKHEGEEKEHRGHHHRHHHEHREGGKK